MGELAQPSPDSEDPRRPSRTRAIVEVAAGLLLVVVGLVLLVLPGPGLLLLAAGLAVIARHVPWVQRLTDAAVVRLRRWWRRIRPDRNTDAAS